MTRSRRVNGAGALLAAALLAALPAGCGSGGSSGTGVASSSTTATATLPGTGRPQITIGDLNFTEQFVLGELYKQALEAQGYDVYLNRNIGPTEVRIPDIESGRVELYPEYLDTWDRDVAGIRHPFASRLAAYQAGQRYALAHGLQLLAPTPFADTPAIAVTQAYARANGLRTLRDLGGAPAPVSLGGPPQFQQDPRSLPALQQTYGFVPAGYTPLAVGTQYAALSQGKVQAAEVNTTDGQLAAPGYRVLLDPQRTFGWGNVVPVVSVQALVAEGPAFAATVERVDRLLTLPVIRRLNAGIDVQGQTAAVVAKQFLQAHGLAPATAP